MLCYNDEVAFELLAALGERGIWVPEDLSIAGFDDAPIANMGEVPLTTMTHPKTEMGVVAADLVDALQNVGSLGTGSDGRDHVLNSELIIRRSTKIAEDTEAVSSVTPNHAN